MTPFAPLLLLLLLQSTPWGAALHNNVSLVPAMGFNNWDEMPLHYPPWVKGFNESEVKRVAEALISTGMASKGFVYVNLDCGWSTGYRNTNGTLQVSTRLFPSAAGGQGLKPLADHLHGLNLKLGIYTSGHQCCSPRNGTDGSEGKEIEDAQQFAAWGIDYVKDDDCGSSPDHFVKMRDAIATASMATGRPMVYSIHSPWTHHPKPGSGVHPSPAESVALANSARTTGDITATWDSILDRAHTNNAFANLSRPGYFNDPDMLEIGNGQLTDAEGRSQLALWSLMRAPLISGTDVSRATAATIKTLTATEVLLVSQDSKVTVQGRCVGRCLSGTKPENPLIWAGPVSSHSNPSSSGHNHHCTVVVVINTGDGPLSGHSLQWASIGLPATAKMSVRDLWAEADKGTATGSVTVSIQAAHDNTMLKLCPAE